jgi:hypothetical protein
MDWEWALEDISIENMWVHPEYRDTPAVLLLLVRYLDDRFFDTPIQVGQYANEKVRGLVNALNRRPSRRQKALCRALA